MTRLQRFLDAQDGIYEAALDELRGGYKRSHWMWFVFPQLAGLGRSETARYYAISGIDEAREYLAHPVLGPRLAECTQAVLSWRDKRDAKQIFGPVDALKFASSMTLFEAAGGGPHFEEALDGFCGSRRDDRTLSLLATDR